MAAGHACPISSSFPPCLQALHGDPVLQACFRSCCRKPSFSRPVSAPLPHSLEPSCPMAADQEVLETHPVWRGTLCMVEEAILGRVGTCWYWGAQRWLHSAIWCPHMGGHVRCITVPHHLNPRLFSQAPRVDRMALKHCSLPPQILQIPQLLLMQRRSWRRS